MKSKRPRKRYDAVQLTPEQVQRYYRHELGAEKAPVPKVRLRDKLAVQSNSSTFLEGLHEVMRGPEKRAGWNDSPHFVEVVSCCKHQRAVVAQTKFENRLHAYWRTR